MITYVLLLDYDFQLTCMIVIIFTCTHFSDTESNMAAMNDLINAKMKTAEERFTIEKESLEKRVLEEHKAQENLKSEKELLQQELKAKREEFEARQKLENEEFEKKLFDTKGILKILPNQVKRLQK